MRERVVGCELEDDEEDAVVDMYVAQRRWERRARGGQV